MGPGEASDRSRSLSPEREATFPNLRTEGYEVTSDEDWLYNCIAHAADLNDTRWWPAKGIEGVYWPGEILTSLRQVARGLSL
jgi:hypothetical protein